jgi:hypothetical protein
MLKGLRSIPGLIAGLAAVSWGTTYNIGTTTVDNWNDDGKCSLAEAAYASNWMVSVNTNDCAAGTGTDIIKLQGGTFAAPVNYVATTTLTFYNRVTIIGGGIDRTLITAKFTDASLSRLISFEDGTPDGLESGIRGVTLTRQSSASPVSGVYSGMGSYVRLVQTKIQKFGLSGVVGEGADIMIDSSSIQDNTSPGVGGGVCIFWGSGEHPGGLVTNSSSITGNAGSIGGGIYYGGDDNSNLYNTTIAGNSAYSGSGGGLFMETHDVGYLDIHGCTITGNTASVSGGGVSENAASTPPHLYGSLVAGNSAPSHKDVEGWYGNVNTMFGDNTGNTATPPLGPGSMVNSTPGIGALRETGWPLNIKTVPLTTANANAVDATITAEGSLTGKDGRGQERMVDGNENGTKTNDFGSFEFDPLFKETDSLGLGPKTAEPHQKYTDPECSGNGCTSFEGSSGTAYITYYARVNRTGTYNLKMRLKKNNNRGIFQLKIGPQGGSVANYGSPVDLYAANPAFVEVNFGNVTFGTVGVKQFKFQLTGKNAASSNYYLYFDYIKLTGP